MNIIRSELKNDLLMKRFWMALLPLLLISCDDDENKTPPKPNTFALHSLEITKLSPSLEGERMYVKVFDPEGGEIMDDSDKLEVGTVLEWQTKLIEPETDLTLKLIPYPDALPAETIKLNFWELVKDDYQDTQTYFREFGSKRIRFRAEIEAI